MKKRMNLKKLVCGMLFMIIVVGAVIIGGSSAQAATATNKVPITAYVKGYSSVRTYRSVGGSATGWIYSSDKCTILNVYSSGWCRVKYPASSGYRTAYTYSSYFFADTNFSASTTKPGKNMSVYGKPNLTKKVGTTYSSDNILLTGKSGGRQQIIYPVSGGYKLGFVSGSIAPAVNYAPIIYNGTTSEIEPYCFDAKYYADTYPDLKAAFGYDEQQLLRHWHKYGIKEGRGASPVLDLKYYMANNADLRKAYGATNYTKAYQHFLKHGYAEYRASSKYYYGDYYRRKYSDLSPYDSKFLVRHYLKHGISEGRYANTVKYTPVSNTSSATLLSPVPSGCKFSKKTNDNGWYGYHDINRNVSKSTPVYAITDGTVTYKQAYRVYGGVKKLTSYGNYIEFTSSNGVYKAKYCHLNQFVGVNQIISSSNTKRASGSTGVYNLGSRAVKRGDIIGYVGTTGNSSGIHLHFELRKNNSRIDPTSVFPGLK